MTLTREQELAERFNERFNRDHITPTTVHILEAYIAENLAIAYTFKDRPEFRMWYSRTDWYGWASGIVTLRIDSSYFVRRTAVEFVMRSDGTVAVCIMPWAASRNSAPVCTAFERWMDRLGELEKMGVIPFRWLEPAPDHITDAYAVSLVAVDTCGTTECRGIFPTTREAVSYARDQFSDDYWYDSDYVGLHVLPLRLGGCDPCDIGSDDEDITDLVREGKE